jgi:methyltransferase (TIGR00027 family)
MSDRGPSVTAAVVAATLLLLGDDPDLRTLAVPEAESIEAAVRATLPIVDQLLRRVPWPLLKRAAFLAERIVSPGFITHYALRKHAVRQQLRRAVDDGFRQVVLIGAGFDMMASSVSHAAAVFEVDHPGTQRLRREGSRATTRRDVTLVPVDLAKSGLREALLAVPSFDADADTVFVAEGVLMYLKPERVHAILASIGACRSNQRLIVTILTPDRSGRVRLHSQRRIVDWCMRWLDEPFVWGERREKLTASLERYGFRVDSILSTTELRDRVLEAAAARRRMPRPTGEVVVVATKSRSVTLERTTPVVLTPSTTDHRVI